MCKGDNFNMISTDFFLDRVKIINRLKYNVMLHFVYQQSALLWFLLLVNIPNIFLQKNKLS